MRLGWLLLGCAACGHKSGDPPAAGAGSAIAVAGSAAPAASANGAALDHITLLEPEAVIGERLTDQDALTSTVKAAGTLITTYDAQHPGALPADFDLVFAARPGAVHGWLVGAAGDIAAPELDKAIAALPAIPVKQGVVALVATFAKPGTAAPQRGPFLPASWKAAAGAAGGSVDDVIAKAWP